MDRLPSRTVPPGRKNRRSCSRGNSLAHCKHCPEVVSVSYPIPCGLSTAYAGSLIEKAHLHFFNCAGYIKIKCNSLQKITAGSQGIFSAGLQMLWVRQGQETKFRSKAKQKRSGAVPAPAFSANSLPSQKRRRRKGYV